MKREELLKEAIKITKGARQTNYGTPEDNFKRIADLWSVYLGRSITPSDVAVMMILMRTARLMNDCKHMDSWVDIAGYAACGGEIVTSSHQPRRGDQ